MQTKEKIAHTPAPWRAEVASDGYDILSSSPEMSATVAITAARPHSLTGQADARLIAAAPELLDALKGMVGLVQLIQARELDLQENHRFVTALEVITKAEGR